ncbi:uncharacterized protein [Onthophagus taurus]|uniref:uncharacterized protein n=1 Tax=Onthophagus taurus TaxID=166361 RepID=UPI0039BECA5A
MAEVIVGHLREFTLRNSDWSIFLPRLESYFTANNIGEDKAKKKRAILLNILDEDAYKLLFDLVSPEKPEDKTYPDLVAVLSSHFQPQKSAFAARYQFYSAKKEVAETAKQWAARLRGLAVSCEFGAELQVCLRDKFVFGFEKGPIMDRLMEEEITKDFNGMVSLAVSKMAANEVRDVIIKQEEIHQLRERRTDFGSRDAQASSSQTKGRQRYPVCSVCGKNNHLYERCYFKNATCSKCKKIGHLAAMCKATGSYKVSNQRNRYKSNKKHHFINDKSDNDQDDLCIFNFESENHKPPFYVNVIVIKILTM